MINCKTRYPSTYFHYNFFIINWKTRYPSTYFQCNLFTINWKTRYPSTYFQCNLFMINWKTRYPSTYTSNVISLWLTGKPDIHWRTTVNYPQILSLYIYIYSMKTVHSFKLRKTSPRWHIIYTHTLGAKMAVN